jgi:hypothetical protein
MKLPSLQQVLAEAVRTVRRFPLVLAVAAVGTLAAIVLLDHEGAARPTVLFNVLFASILGISTLLTIALTAEKGKWGRTASLGAQAAGILALAAYACSIPTDLGNAPEFHFFRLLMVGTAMHLFASVVPFAGSREVNGFWHFNKALLLRALTSVLFSGVLFAGLAVALGALDNLFGVHVSPKRYGELWVLVAGVFTTWFFVGGIPEDLDALESETEYPRAIKLFAQYILLPLTLVYLVILYAYLGKILIAWDWPQGWVSRLILGFAGVGMLMHLLFYPIQDRDENVWIRRACRWFYVAMAPLVVVFLLAVARRTSEYGITEGRYIAVATGIWLGAMVVYFLASKRKNIKIIPVSLGAVALMICWGPWGAFSVAESSQVNRLEELLKASSILVDGKVRPAEKRPPYGQVKEISSILSYLYSVHGYERIQPWFTVSLKADSAGAGQARKDPLDVAKLLGVQYVRVWEGKGLNDVSLRADGDQPIEIGGYDRLWRAQAFSADGKRVASPGGDLAYSVSAGLDTLTLISLKEGRAADSVRVDMRRFVETLLLDEANRNTANVPPAKMSIAVSTATMKVKVYVRQLAGERQDGVLKLTTYDCTILYSLAGDARP